MLLKASVTDKFHNALFLRLRFLVRNSISLHQVVLFPFLFTGMLQREHPGIAISVKTRQAIRTILNNARDVIHELRGGGLLDEAEAGKLESVKKMVCFAYVKY